MSTAFSIVRVFDAVREEVFGMWTDAEEVKKWWSPEGYTCTSAKIDARVGGKYLANMVAPDGKVTWSTGEYKEVIKNEKLVMSDNFADEHGNIISPEEVGMPGYGDSKMQITVVFEDNEVQGRTTMIMTHEGIPLDMQADCEKGWEQLFDKLEVALTN